MNHVDVEHQVQALRLDPSPVLMGQRSIQVDGGHHIVELVVSSVRFYTGQRLAVVLGGLPHDVPQGLGEVGDMLSGPGGDLQSLQGSPRVHGVPEHRQDGLLVPLRGGGAQHRAKEELTEKVQQVYSVRSD